jgi:hypothetical protein
MSGVRAMLLCLCNELHERKHFLAHARVCEYLHEQTAESMPDVCYRYDGGAPFDYIESGCGVVGKRWKFSSHVSNGCDECAEICMEYCEDAQRLCFQCACGMLVDADDATAHARACEAMRDYLLTEHK